MSTLRKCSTAAAGVVLMAGILWAATLWAQDETPRELSVTVGKALLVDSPVMIQRIAVGNSEVAEATATTPQEILVNGKAPGETTLIVWQVGGNRLIFDLTVLKSNVRLDSVRRELRTQFPDQDIQVDLDGETPVIKGVAKDLTSAQHALDLVRTLGNPVNLLRVTVPPADAQILIKVKFADVDRTAQQQLGINLFSTGATNTIGTISTQQFSPPAVTGTIGGGAGAAPPTLSLSNALNLFLFRPDLNLGATIEALQTNNLLQILAEPNVLAMNGKQASFLEGGEFPFPTLQGGGGGLGQVTIQFREFGVRITFTPTVTPRGTIHMIVQPEVSSLDFANGLVFNGFTIPSIDSRKVSTEVELGDGQTFAIGGLLDNRVTQNLNKIPGLSSIPLLGKLFQSRSVSKTNTELLVMVTPEIVRPIPMGQSPPGLNYPEKFLKPNTPGNVTQTPGPEVTGPPPPAPTQTIAMEDLIQSLRPPAVQAQAPTLQFVPMMVAPPSGAPAAPANVPAPAPAPSQLPAAPGQPQ
jgi:pilus assembly protein CpaC